MSITGIQGSQRPALHRRGDIGRGIVRDPSNHVRGGDPSPSTSLRVGISENSYFSTPICATAMLSRVEFLTMYIISSAWRMISCELLASSG